MNKEGLTSNMKNPKLSEIDDQKVYINTREEKEYVKKMKTYKPKVRNVYEYNLKNIYKELKSVTGLPYAMSNLIAEYAYPNKLKEEYKNILRTENGEGIELDRVITVSNLYEYNFKKFLMELDAGTGLPFVLSDMVIQYMYGNKLKDWFEYTYFQDDKSYIPIKQADHFFIYQLILEKDSKYLLKVTAPYNPGEYTVYIDWGEGPNDLKETRDWEELDNLISGTSHDYEWGMYTIRVELLYTGNKENLFEFRPSNDYLENILMRGKHMVITDDLGILFNGIPPM